MFLEFKQKMILKKQMEFENFLNKMIKLIKEGTNQCFVLNSIIRQDAVLPDLLK